MDQQTKNDVDLVLNAMMAVAKPQAIEVWAEDTGNTEADLDAAMKRLGNLVGLDAGIL